MEKGKNIIESNNIHTQVVTLVEFSSSTHTHTHTCFGKIGLKERVANLNSNMHTHTC